ncbi:arrestin domain-containing protein 17 [Drosophila biarmipes]|uniref:arrestin domain-containing protein 17 n=1 Tax=Drosophila biarmipes TaxID=125945 RepID=UPI0007E71569|nr:arrestin domain-containing protein 17 [Drosophila biarmipes]
MRCSFEFDRSDPIYFSGETISGRAVLTTKSELSVNEIFLLFVGEGKVRFQDVRELSLTGHEVFRGRQTYLSTRTNVNESGTLPAGTHTFPFSTFLPPDCPSSVVSEYGKIWYEIELCIGLPDRQSKIFKKPLTVLQTYNLNMSPLLLIPLVHEDIKHFCCWHCRSGPVLSTLTIPFGGYAPGQKVRFNLEVDNQSSRRDLVGMEMRLKQVYKLQAQTPALHSYEEEHIVAHSYQKAKVLRLSKREIEGTLTIPAVPPSSRESNIVSVSYEVQLTIDLNDCQTDPDLYVPIVIGTIPLVQSAEDPAHVAELIARVPDNPSILVTQRTPTSDLPPNDDYGPPTFEEATIVGKKFMDIDEEEEGRSDHFMPRYPMYTNFGRTPPPHSKGSGSAVL